MQMRFTSVLLCAIGVWSAALAQPASAPNGKVAAAATVSPVTVQAGLPPKVIQKQANSFVQSYAATPNPRVDQIGRWRDPVCVHVWGLPLATQAAKIKARIESTAQEVGLPAARPGCKINVEIVFTDKPQSMMDIVAQRWEALLGYYHHEKTTQLKAVTHPIQAWYVTGTEGDGVDIGALNFQDLSGPPASYVQQFTSAVDDPRQPLPAACLDRFTACYKSEFGNVLIVADSKALDGKNLRLIADDMVMLALSQPKSLDGCNALPSVIDGFAKSPCPGRDPPNGLTQSDAAYLAALYSADPEGKKTVEYADIGERMAKILIKGGAAGAADAAAPANAPAR